MTSAAIHVDQLWFDLPGGVGTYVRNLVPALRRLDPALDLTLFHARFGGDDPPEPWLADHRVETVPGSIRRLYPSWNAARRPRLPASVASADVVHAASAVAVPPALPRQRLVVTVHDVAFLRVPEAFPRRWRALYRLGLRAAARRADVLLAPSRSTAEDVVERTRIDPARVRVTPLAATLPTSSSDPDPVVRRLGVPTPYVLFVGTLEPRKNLVRLVRAYRRAAAEGLPHALVLAGPLGWASERLLRELAIDGPGRIARTGWLSEDDLDAVYRRASAFVYPSLSEGFGLPVLEAMARGVPTITSNTSSLPEVAGDAAVAVDPTSIVELAAAIETVLGDGALSARLADAGRRRAERFSWDDTARLTLAAYEAAS